MNCPICGDALELLEKAKYLTHKPPHRAKCSTYMHTVKGEPEVDKREEEKTK